MGEYMWKSQDYLHAGVGGNAHRSSSAVGNDGGSEAGHAIESASRVTRARPRIHFYLLPQSSLETSSELQEFRDNHIAAENWGSWHAITQRKTLR